MPVPRFTLRRLTTVLYGYSFLDDFVLLYPAYTLLFADHGLTAWQISSLFVLWSATGIVLEVPSGVWADTRSRRLLICTGPILTAAGFLLWTLTPSYAAFAVGFLLWGTKGALASGALEALVYEELDRLGAADRYADTMGRARAAGVTAVLAATVCANPVLAAGGYRAVGLAGVAACLATATVALFFPEDRGKDHAASGPRTSAGSPAEPGYIATLRIGLAEARTVPAVWRWVLVMPAVAAIWGALEEYTPLLVRDTGVATATVPLLLALLWGGVTAGGLLAGAGRRLSSRGLAILLAVAALAMSAGAVTGRPAGIGLVALAFGAFQLVTVVADARLQAAITGPSRATITSLASLATDAGTIATYAGYALLAPSGPRVVFALFAIPYLVIAGAIGLGAATGSAPVVRPGR
jgi:MFS family permease